MGAARIIWGSTVDEYTCEVQLKNTVEKQSLQILLINTIEKYRICINMGKCVCVCLGGGYGRAGIMWKQGGGSD